MTWRAGRTVSTLLMAGLLASGFGALSARPVSAAPGGLAVRSSDQSGIAPAWLTCNGHHLKTGDVGGAFSGKPAPPFVTAATRIQSTTRVLNPRVNQLIGFAVYRSWASPHWLQVESYAAATLCNGPWVGSVDGRGLLYAPGRLRPQVPPGRFYLALLWTRTATDPTPKSFLYAELSSRQFQLPLPARSTIPLWTCSLPVLSGPCHSALFRIF